jgi:hypothetical protein
MELITKENFSYITEEIKSKEEAIRSKMELIQPKILGIQLVKYELIHARKVYIPYTFLTFSYEIKRKFGLRREGEIAIVFDMNEVHSFHFDLKDDQLKTDKMAISQMDGIRLPEQCSDHEAESQSIEMIQWKILYRFYRSSGSVHLNKRTKFYRPAWELDLHCNNKQFIKYAFLDPYDSSNEQIAGLRVRLEN